MDTQQETRLLLETAWFCSAIVGISGNYEVGMSLAVLQPVRCETNVSPFHLIPFVGHRPQYAAEETAPSKDRKELSAAQGKCPLK